MFPDDIEISTSMTINELSRMLGVSYATIYRYITKGTWNNSKTELILLESFKTPRGRCTTIPHYNAFVRRMNS